MSAITKKILSVLWSFDIFNIVAIICCLISGRRQVDSNKSELYFGFSYKKFCPIFNDEKSVDKYKKIINKYEFPILAIQYRKK
jgi:hypothetical protein